MRSLSWRRNHILKYNGISRSSRGRSTVVSWEAGLLLNISKCKFFTTTVKYLGHINRLGRLEIDHTNTTSLGQAYPSTTRTQLPFCLGLIKDYRRFIPRMPTTAGTLHEVLKEDAPHNFVLSKYQLVSFRTLIDAVLSPEVLALPLPGLPYSVDTNASNYGLGCSFFQSYANGVRRPIGFWSRSLNYAERNYLLT